MSIEFIETPDLLKELQTRMDCMIFIGCSNRTEKEDALLFACCGSFHGCLGLIEASRMMVTAQGGTDDELTN